MPSPGRPVHGSRSRARAALTGAGARPHRRRPCPRSARACRPPIPAGCTQLVNLGIPFGYGEQAPFLGREISALRLTTADDGGGDATADTTGRSSIAASSSGSVARPNRSSPRSTTASSLAGGTTGYVYLGVRIVRGWAIEFVLLVALIPFLVGVVDLFARSRRRRLPLAGAWRALRTRLGVWLWVGLRDRPWPRSPASSRAAPRFRHRRTAPPSRTGLWSVSRTSARSRFSAGWRARRALVPRRPTRRRTRCSPDTRSSLLALGAIAIATAVISPYALLFIIPSLYAWLWLPQIDARPRLAARLLCTASGSSGPALAWSQSEPSSSSV